MREIDREERAESSFGTDAVARVAVSWLRFRSRSRMRPVVAFLLGLGLVTSACSAPPMSVTSPAPEPTVQAAPSVAPAPGVAGGRTYKIGDIGPGGGKIFYVPDSRLDSYLEAAPSGWDHGGGDPSSRWSCAERNHNSPRNPGRPNSPRGPGTKLGTGADNTGAILSTCVKSRNAAYYASVYRGGGKADWYLPSEDELREMDAHKDVVGGLDWNPLAGRDCYWSSTWTDEGMGTATCVSFAPWGGLGTNLTGARAGVRPVRMVFPR